jgi:hypothetical protein
MSCQLQRHGITGYCKEKRRRGVVGRYVPTVVTVLAYLSGFAFGSEGLTAKIRVHEWEAGLH